MELTVLKEEQDVLDINGSCRICHNGDLVVMPDYETVAQWELRKNEKYPDTAPVYCLVIICGSETGWSCTSKSNAERLGKTNLIIATETGAPPNDWRPV
jgi:glutamine synthetase